MGRQREVSFESGAAAGKGPLGGRGRGEPRAELLINDGDGYLDKTIRGKVTSSARAGYGCMSCLFFGGETIVVVKFPNGRNIGPPDSQSFGF